MKDWSKTAAAEQSHNFLHCMSGTFRGASSNWSVIEKEGYPIVRACSELDYLLIRDKGSKMFTDHRNLSYIFAPGTEIKKHVRGKLLRWSLKLNEFKYEIEHIPGDENVWADMFSRWAGQNPAVTRTTSMKRWESVKQPQLRPLAAIEWPTIEDVIAAQSGMVAPTSHNLDGRGVDVASYHRPWVPDTAGDLLQRLMVIAHCGSQGHRGVNAMVKELEGYFDIRNVHIKARPFCGSCLLCCHVKGGNTIPRPYGELYRSSERNEALHMDYLLVGKYDDSSDYILVLKDDYSHFCELVPCKTADSVTAAGAILQWNMRFGSTKVLISDTAAHFKNELLAELCRCTQTRQDFTVVYCPWINGSVERINRDILQVLRVMILEFRLRQEQWVDVLPLIQANLNQTPVQSLANMAPIEVFTGLEKPSPLKSIVVTSDEGKEYVVTLDDLPAAILDKVDTFRLKFHNMHKNLEQAKVKQTRRNQRNQRTAHTVNFHIGDYVLSSWIESRLKTNKLSVKWTGTYRVIDAKPNSFTVEHLINGSTRDVHASRLKHYVDSSFEETAEIVEHIVNQDIYLTAREFVQHRLSDDHDYDILVAWEGLEDIENSWETIELLGARCTRMCQ
ncbi:unnamed protein product [Phytophthora fragariaefolia]|uniref:Unnamed protein product n=1 Tax=Phytophthora fragariaefolia TaxID=1490495 RepID=A0A9W6U3L6_9STRA|nr:unnamed protein product [Phytophthora fragariaefolia]